jgi:hypothetical protein
LKTRHPVLKVIAAITGSGRAIHLLSMVMLIVVLNSPGLEPPSSPGAIT